jgi:hypothetical protein
MVIVIEGQELVSVMKAIQEHHVKRVTPVTLVSELFVIKRFAVQMIVLMLECVTISQENVNATSFDMGKIAPFSHALSITHIALSVTMMAAQNALKVIVSKLMRLKTVNVSLVIASIQDVMNAMKLNVCNA